MTITETFKCQKLKAIITVGRCLQSQKQALEFWGPEASKFQSCPCDQGREFSAAAKPSISVKVEDTIKTDPDSGAIDAGIPMGGKPKVEGKDMSAKKDCRNCERNMAIAQDGLCGGCFNRGKGLTGSDQLIALAKAREDFKGKGPLTTGKRGPQINARKKAEKPLSAKLSSRKTDRKPEKSIIQYAEMASLLPSLDAVDSVTIHFTSADAALSEGLLSLARKYRRTPDQQLLWMLEKEISIEHLVSPEKAVDHVA
jgi:hypothetical protein